MQLHQLREHRNIIKKRRQEWKRTREGSKCMLSKQLLNSDATDEQREREIFRKQTQQIVEVIFA